MENNKTIYTIGMIHLPGVNDKAYAEWLTTAQSVEPNNLWFTLP